MPLTNKQQEYLNNCNHRWSVKTGATGSGKTFVDIAATIPKRILKCRGEGLIVLMGNTKGTLERNILSPMRDLYGPLVGTISSDNTVQVFGKKVYALGADNKKHVARIQGASMEYVYGDEVTTWSEEVFQMLKSRLRCEHSHFDGTCNPDHPSHWFKKFLDSDADIYQQAYVIEDGVLPKDIVEQLKKEYAGTVYYDRFIRGLWVAADGVIYKVFADNPDRFICKRELVDFHSQNHLDIVKASIGVDFGGGTSAHAFCCTGFTRGMKKVVVLDEYREKEALTPEKLNQVFADFVRSCKERWFVTDVYCDSAEQTLINGFRQTVARERLMVNVGNALKKPINERIRATCVLMGADRFLISEDCKETIDAFRSAVWDAKKITEDVRLDNGTTNIDSLDAYEYSVEREIPSLLGVRV